MSNVFEGLKVIDAANDVAGPAAAVLLADFGADVVKIEPPGAGDLYRNVPRMPNLPKSEHNWAWTMAARTKRGLALDLKHLDGQAVLHRMIAKADVFITNQSPKARERLGCSHEMLSAINPRLIYASLTGYGETGPEAERPGFDATAYWARSGLADAVRPDPNGPPAVVNMAMGDQPAAVALYAAIVTGLLQRERTGKGQWVTTSLLANGVWANAVMVQAALCGAEIPYRQPRHKAHNALTCYYLCSDRRWLSLLIMQEQRDWPRFVQAMGKPRLAQDPRFSELAQRHANAADLVQELDAVFVERTAAEWQRRFEAEGLSVGVVARTEDAVHDEQMRIANALVPAQDVPFTGLTVDSPFQVAGLRKVAPRAAPGVGEHSDAVLLDYGLTAADVAALRRDGVVG